jgi:hypothetical protein
VSDSRCYFLLKQNVKEFSPCGGKELKDYVWVSYLFPYVVGACGSVVVKALCFKQEGRGFDFR